MLKAEERLIVCKGWSFPIDILQNIIVFVEKKVLMKEGNCKKFKT